MVVEGFVHVCLAASQKDIQYINLFCSQPIDCEIEFLCILMTVILYSGGDTVIRIYMLVTVRGERVTEN